MMYSLKSTFIVILSLMLIACDPAFEAVADRCANGENSEIVLALDFTDPDVSPYTVLAGSESKEYRLYLQDILAAAEPADGVTLTADEQLAIDNLMSIINDDGDDLFNLQYDVTDGAVTQASNPLDYIESLISATAKADRIGAFEDAREQIEAGISSDDDFCIYQNRNIRFVNQDGEAVLFGELTLSYNPFSRIVQQQFLITEVRGDLSNSVDRQTVPYFGFSQADVDDYEDKGYYPSIVRSMLLNSIDDSKSLVVDDGNDNSLGQIEISTSNIFCRDDDDNITACDMGITTRVPQKSQCDGTDDPDSDETGQLQVRTMDLNGSLTELKRIRLETDYENQEVRLYASSYNEAIYDSDGTTVITDPTNCEKQAVLDELADMTPGVGVSLTVVPDINYDITYDDDGNVETVPVFSFTGTAIPSRQP